MRFARFCHTVVRSSTFVFFLLAGLSPSMSSAGRLTPGDVEGLRSGAIALAGSARVKSVTAAAAVATVVEYYHAGLDNYFITADPVEQAAVDGGAAGAFQRTGNEFLAGGTNQVCRFYGNTNVNPATGGIYGPNSHFYTADPQECASLKAQFDPNAKSWKFESNDFLTTPAVNGACPANLLPVYRAYNNGFARGVDSNHRITANHAAYLATVARGWIGEGIVMCAPKPTDSILPAQLAACGESDCPAGATELGNGASLVNVTVEITNSGSTAIQLVIPAGQTFQATPATVQNGIAMETLQATVPAGTTRQFVLHLFCMNQDRAASHAGDSYAPGPVTTNAHLADLASLTNGRLGPALDPSMLKTGATQFAIWEITNGTGALSANQRSLIVALLATAGDDLQGQATLYQQFLATLTFS